MKTKFLIALALLPVISLVAFAREKKDFDDALKKLGSSVENYNSDKYYDSMEFKNKTTGEKKKFKDFTDVQRFTFYILNGISINGSLEEMQNHWQEELNKAEETSSGPTEANRRDIEKYLDKLMDLRKKNALKLENLANEFFDKWPKEYTQEEKEYLLKSIKDYHDKHKLIKRD